MGLGWVLKRAFKFPAWTIAAISFNNTTALPLMLLQALDTSGTLKDLTGGEDSTSALSRARSYFLISATVGNSLTFAFGPRLLDDEEAPDKEDQKREDSNGQSGRDQQAEGDEERANPRNTPGQTSEEEDHDDETTTLLPDPIVRRERALREEISKRSGRLWDKLPWVVQRSLPFLGSFLNAPLIGAAIGAILGLAPPLHKAFFNEPEEGGFFKAWLTNSIKNVGELFPALQLVVVGAKLSCALNRMKKGESSGSVPVIPMLSIFFIRFILWPM
jgi:predicted permease